MARVSPRMTTHFVRSKSQALWKAISEKATTVINGTSVRYAWLMPIKSMSNRGMTMQMTPAGRPPSTLPRV